MTSYKQRVMCARKIAHVKFTEAEKHLKRLLEEPTVTEPKRLHIYHCPFAPKPDPHWHVGHRREAEHKRLLNLGLI